MKELCLYTITQLTYKRLRYAGLTIGALYNHGCIIYVHYMNIYIACTYILYRAYYYVCIYVYSASPPSS